MLTSNNVTTVPDSVATIPDAQISSTDPHPRGRVAVLDTEMSYVDTGQGDRSCSFMEIRPLLTFGETLFPILTSTADDWLRIWWEWGSPANRRRTRIASSIRHAIWMSGSRP